MKDHLVISLDNLQDYAGVGWGDGKQVIPLQQQSWKDPRRSGFAIRGAGSGEIAAPPA